MDHDGVVCQEFDGPDTEAGAVNEIDLLACEGEIGGEEHLSRLGLLFGVVINGDDHADDTLEADGVELRVMERDDGAAVVDGRSGEDAFPRHLAEVDASRYGEVANHGLDDEFFLPPSHFLTYFCTNYIEPFLFTNPIG